LFQRSITIENFTPVIVIKEFSEIETIFVAPNGAGIDCAAIAFRTACSDEVVPTEASA